VNINDSVVSKDQSLKVTLVAFDPNRGKGLIEVEELSMNPAWFYINVKFGGGGQFSVNYKTWDTNKASSYGIETSVKNDVVASIELTRMQ